METDEAYFLLRKKWTWLGFECLKLCLENGGNEYRNENTEGKAGDVKFLENFLT